MSFNDSIVDAEGHIVPTIDEWEHSDLEELRDDTTGRPAFGGFALLADDGKEHYPQHKAAIMDYIFHGGDVPILLRLILARGMQASEPIDDRCDVSDEYADPDGFHAKVEDNNDGAYMCDMGDMNGMERMDAMGGIGNSPIFA
ncbi:MAG: hypothetical protein Q9157_004103 [Trypethelium eluteriae]